MKRTIFWGFTVLVMAVIGQSVFAQSAESDFETAADMVNGGVTITKYVGWDGEIVIPAIIGGKPVTAIGKEAFAKQDNLTSVTIPNSVIDIGESAFDTNKLTSVTIPASVKTIGERAFYDNSLAKITIGDNVIMGAYTFSRNKDLIGITLGANCVFDLSTFGYNKHYGERTQGEQIEGIVRRGMNLHYDYFGNARKAGAYALDIKERAMKNDGDFQYVETRYGAVLTRYTGSSTALRFPEKVGGLAVKYIMVRFPARSITRILIPSCLWQKNAYQSDLEGPQGG